MNRYYAAVVGLAVVAGVIAALADHGVPFTGAWTTGVLLAVAYSLGQNKARHDVSKKIDAVLARHNRDEAAS